MNKKKADKYSKEFIIADGHIDLPYRLYKEGLLYEKNINLMKLQEISIYQKQKRRIKLSVYGNIYSFRKIRG